MQLLEDRIRRDGIVKEGNVLKVDSFLNHQMDIELFQEMGKEFRRLFPSEKINKILTIEASGIGIACIAAQYFGNVPVVFAKKSQSINLDGEQSDVRNHKLQILADEYLPVDEGGIPHDGLKSVAGTSFDFRSAKIIASEFLADDDQRKVKGYDHAFLLQAKGDGKKVAAHVWSADEKLQLKVYTTAPALQFYSGNYLGGTPSRGTEPYADWQGLALESEFLPDSPNHPEWPQPDCFLRPGEEYSSLTEYQFIAE